MATLTNLRFCDEQDMLRLYPDLDRVWPRQNKQGQPLRDWSVQIDLAMDEIERELRARKGTSEPVELGRLGIRTKQRLRPVCAHYAVHFIFVAADVNGDDTGFFVQRANYFYKRAFDILEDEMQMIDYDADNSGTIDDFEKNQPLPIRFVRG